MSRIITILIIPVLIIAGSLRYYIYYRSAINRHLNDENYRERTHNPAPVYILLGITIISLLVSNSHNQLAITNLQNSIFQLSNQVGELNRKIEEIGQKDSTLYSYGLDLTDLEKQNGQYVATVRVRIYPKQMRENTVFTLRYENENLVMMEENGVYYTDIQFLSARGGGSAVLSIESDGKIQNDEIFLEGEKIMGTMLPSVFLTGSSEISNNTFRAEWTIHTTDSRTRKITDAVLVIKDGTNSSEYDLKDALNNRRTDVSVKEKISSENSFTAEIVYHDDQGFTYVESIYSPTAPGHLEVTDSEGIQVLVL